MADRTSYLSVEEKKNSLLVACRKGKELFLFINRSRALNGLNGAASILSRLFYIYVDKEGGGK